MPCSKRILAVCVSCLFLFLTIQFWWCAPTPQNSMIWLRILQAARNWLTENGPLSAWKCLTEQLAWRIIFRMLTLPVMFPLLWSPSWGGHICNHWRDQQTWCIPIFVCLSGNQPFEVSNLVELIYDIIRSTDTPSPGFVWSGFWMEPLFFPLVHHGHWWAVPNWHATHRGSLSWSFNRISGKYPCFANIQILLNGKW